MLVKIPSSQPSTAVTSTIHTSGCRVEPKTQLTSTVRVFASSSAMITTSTTIVRIACNETAERLSAAAGATGAGRCLLSLMRHPLHHAANVPAAVKGKRPCGSMFARSWAHSLMAEIPHETPGPSGPGRSTATRGPGGDPPAVKSAEAGRSGQVEPEDTAAGDEGPYPDPDEYADPDTQGAHSAHDAGGR